MKCHEGGATVERGPFTIEEAESRFSAARTHAEMADALHWAQRHAKSLFGRAYDPNHPNRMRVVRAMNAARERVAGGTND